MAVLDGSAITKMLKGFGVPMQNINKILGSMGNVAGKTASAVESVGNAMKFDTSKALGDSDALFNTFKNLTGSAADLASIFPVVGAAMNIGGKAADTFVSAVKAADDANKVYARNVRGAMDIQMAYGASLGKTGDDFNKLNGTGTSAFVGLRASATDAMDNLYMSSDDAWGKLRELSDGFTATELAATNFSSASGKNSGGIGLLTASMLAASGAGLDASRGFDIVRESALQFGDSADEAMGNIASLKDVSNASGVSIRQLDESFGNARKTLRGWGATGESVARIQGQFVKSIKESGFGVAEANETFGKYVSSLSNMSIGTRSLLSSMGGLAPGKGAIGGALEVEFLLSKEGGDKGLEKVSQGMAKSLMRFGGAIKTFDEARKGGPEAQRQFVMQREMLKKMTGISDDPTANKMLGVLSKINKGTATAADKTKMENLISDGSKKTEAGKSEMEKVAKNTELIKEKVGMQLGNSKTMVDLLKSMGGSIDSAKERENMASSITEKALKGAAGVGEVLSKAGEKKSAKLKEEAYRKDKKGNYVHDSEKQAELLDMSDKAKRSSEITGKLSSKGGRGAGLDVNEQKRFDDTRGQKTKKENQTSPAEASTETKTRPKPPAQDKNQVESVSGPIKATDSINNATASVMSPSSSKAQNMLSGVSQTGIDLKSEDKKENDTTEGMGIKSSSYAVPQPKEGEASNKDELGFQSYQTERMKSGNHSQSDAKWREQYAREKNMKPVRPQDKVTASIPSAPSAPRAEKTKPIDNELSDRDRSDMAMRDSIEKKYGKEGLYKDGKVDTKHLRSKIMEDPEKKDQAAEGGGAVGYGVAKELAKSIDRANALSKGSGNEGPGMLPDEDKPRTTPMAKGGLAEGVAGLPEAIKMFMSGVKMYVEAAEKGITVNTKVKMDAAGNMIAIAKAAAESETNRNRNGYVNNDG